MSNQPTTNTQSGNDNRQAGQTKPGPSTNEARPTAPPGSGGKPAK